MESTVGTSCTVLGPVTVVMGGSPAALSPQQRTLLAALLLDAGHLVPVFRLAEALWGAHPPDSARNVVQVQVSRLRRSLATAGDVAIDTCPGGYRLTVDPGHVDVHRFAGL